MRKEARQLYPGLADLAQRESERLFRLHTELRRAELIERSDSLLDVLGAISDRYENDEARTGPAGFRRPHRAPRSALREPRAADWVLYKLDGGIDHILSTRHRTPTPGSGPLMRIGR